MKILEDFLKEITQDEIDKHIQEKAKKELAEKKFKYSLSKEFSKIEGDGNVISDVVVTPELFSDIRKTIREADLETNRNKIIKGLMAYLWGSNVWVHKNIPGPENLKVYAKNDPSLKSDFPDFAEFKKELLKKS